MRELKTNCVNISRITEENRAADHYAVIGNPIEHSLSPRIHTAFAEQTHQDIRYEKIKSPLNQFAETIRHAIHQGMQGCNVTAPFKEQAFQLASAYTKSAYLSEVANTLWFGPSGEIVANNTDGIGLIRDLVDRHHIVLKTKRILVIGAGGAVKGILGALWDALPESITIANRDVEKARYLQQKYQHRGLSFATCLENIKPSPFDLIIHATSLGHQGCCPTLPAGIVGENTCCYDLSYGKASEPFLNWANQQGAKHCLNGLGMLVEQAAASFYWWRGVWPSVDSIFSMLQ